LTLTVMVFRTKTPAALLLPLLPSSEAATKLMDDSYDDSDLD
jgi:hypothetical protein